MFLSRPKKENVINHIVLQHFFAIKRSRVKSWTGAGYQIIIKMVPTDFLFSASAHQDRPLFYSYL